MQGFEGRLSQIIQLYISTFKPGDMAYQTVMAAIVNPQELSWYTNCIKIPDSFSEQTLDTMLNEDGGAVTHNNRSLFYDEGVNTLFHTIMHSAPYAEIADDASSDGTEYETVPNTGSADADSDDPDADLITAQLKTMIQSMATLTDMSVIKKFVDEFVGTGLDTPSHGRNIDDYGIGAEERQSYINDLETYVVNMSTTHGIWGTIKDSVFLNPAKDTSSYTIYTWRNALKMWEGASHEIAYYDPRQFAINYEADGLPAYFECIDRDAVREMVGLPPCPML